MAATSVSLSRPSAAGGAPMTPVAADSVNGNTVPNRPSLLLVLANTDAVSHTVTFTTTATVDGYAVADPQVTLAAGETKNFSRFPAGAFGLDLTFTADSSTVTIEAYQTQ